MLFCAKMSVQQNGFISLPLKDRFYMYSYTYIFVSTVTVIAAVSIVIMAFVACGSGEEEPTAPQRYVVI